MSGQRMNSLNNSIYNNEEVLFTLAWLSNCNVEASPKKIVSKAIQLGLITVQGETLRSANGKNIFRRLKNPRVTFPHYNQIKDLTKILIGLGEMSAWSIGDFIDVIRKIFSGFFYRTALSKVLNEVLENKAFLTKKRSLEEISYFQKIETTDFDSRSYERVINDLIHEPRGPRYKYGAAFVVKLCLRVIPVQLSLVVEKNKGDPIVVDLCYPAIEPLMFRDEQYVVPLLKSKSAYLKLLACASLVGQGPFDVQSTIDDNIKIFITNGVDIGDAIWLSSIKLSNHYRSVERIRSQIKSARHEILVCEKSPSNCPKGCQPEQWITSRKDELKRHEERLITAEGLLKSGFDDMKAHWPLEGIESYQIENLLHSIKDEKLSRELATLVPSKSNQEQLLGNALSSVMQWIGISSKPILAVCENTFSYSSEDDIERLVSAAKTLVLLSDIKGKVVGRLLGNYVGTRVQTLEHFLCSPYMSVRKHSQWQSGLTRLACIHLLAVCVFEETPEDKDNQISKIVPMVVEGINLLLKVQDTQLNIGADKLFNDLKRVTAHIISSKNYMSSSAEKVVIDTDLPPDYKVRIIASKETLITKHSHLLLKLFEEFSVPSINIDGDNKYFSNRICLLDICIAHCWKFKAERVAKEIICIWQQYCLLYGDNCSEYVEYAQRLYLALSEDGQDRKWLLGLNGFEQSNCINFLKKSLA